MNATSVALCRSPPSWNPYCLPLILTCYMCHISIHAAIHSCVVAFNSSLRAVRSFPLFIAIPCINYAIYISKYVPHVCSLCAYYWSFLLLFYYLFYIIGRSVRPYCKKQVSARASVARSSFARYAHIIAFVQFESPAFTSTTRLLSYDTHRTTCLFLPHVFGSNSSTMYGEQWACSHNKNVCCGVA